MARILDKRIDEAWQAFALFRSQRESYGALRELGKVALLSEGLSARQRALWRKRLSDVQLTSAEVAGAKERGQEKAAKARTLIDAMSELIDEEIILLMSTVSGLELASLFLMSYADETLNPEIEGLGTELGKLRESTELGSRIRKLESRVNKNAGFDIFAIPARVN